MSGTKFTLSFIITGMYTFLLCSLIAWDINPANWWTIGRIGAIFLWALWFGFLVDKEEKEKGKL